MDERSVVIGIGVIICTICFLGLFLKRLIGEVLRANKKVDASSKKCQDFLERSEIDRGVLASAIWNALRTAGKALDFVDWCQGHNFLDDATDGVKAQKVIFKLPVGLLLELLSALPDVVNSDVDRFKYLVEGRMEDYEKMRHAHNEEVNQLNQKLASFPYYIAAKLANLEPAGPLPALDWNHYGFASEYLGQAPELAVDYGDNGIKWAKSSTVTNSRSTVINPNGSGSTQKNQF